jgi:hypothetical protein
VTVPAFTIAPGQTMITVPNVTVNIPGATAAGGQAALQCNGVSVGSVSYSVSFSGTVSATSATLDTATKKLTLTSATLDLSAATVDIQGMGSFPLPSPTVTLPSITISY